MDLWKDWLGAEDTVAERERELLRTREEASSSGEELVVYKFNVLVSASVTPGSTAEPVTVLDGRRLVVRSGQVATYHDRWENVRRLQVEFLGRQGNGPRRYRVRGLSPVIVEGRPILSSTPGGTTGASWYETSPLYPGVRRLLRPSSRDYRDLILIRPAPEEPAPPAGLPSGEKGVTALWELFVKRYLLNVSEHAEPQELSYRRELLRHLRLPEAIPALRRILTLAPSVETARCLHELGDRSGEDYLLKELHQNEFTRRLRAASVLSQLGHPGGVEALIELASQDPARFSKSPYRYQTFASLTQYINVEPSDENDAVRAKILDFVFAQLDIPTFQYSAFNIVRLVAGNDFGYMESRRIRGAAAKASVERAVENARRWWREHKNKN